MGWKMSWMDKKIEKPGGGMNGYEILMVGVGFLLFVSGMIMSFLPWTWKASPPHNSFVLVYFVFGLTLFFSGAVMMISGSFLEKRRTNKKRLI